MEMDLDEVNEYIEYFDEILKKDGLCFLSNRVLKRTYFFSYNFKKTFFKKIFLKKDGYYFSKKNYKLSSIVNLLLQKKDRNYFNFNFIHFIFGIFYLKKWELIFWTKHAVKKLLKII
jgi:hypothetical protein